MSAHEFMNMARVRAEQAEARAAKAERERDEARRVVRRLLIGLLPSPELRGIRQAAARWDAEAEA